MRLILLFSDCSDDSWECLRLFARRGLWVKIVCCAVRGMWEFVGFRVELLVDIGFCDKGFGRFILSSVVVVGVGGFMVLPGVRVFVVWRCGPGDFGKFMEMGLVCSDADGSWC